MRWEGGLNLFFTTYQKQAADHTGLSKKRASADQADALK
jgi:hypothetical protein